MHNHKFTGIEDRCFSLFSRQNRGCVYFVYFYFALKYLNKLVLFVITAAGGVSCGGRKMYPHTSSMVQILCFVRSSVISDDILRTQK